MQDEVLETTLDDEAILEVELEESAIVDTEIMAIQRTGVAEEDHSKLNHLGYDESGHTGFQSEITSDKKLSSDLIDDSEATNKFISTNDLEKLGGIESGAEVNVQADWNESDSSSDAFIRNKPNMKGIGTITEDCYAKNLEDGVYILSTHKVYLFGTSTTYYVKGAGYIFISTKSSSSKYFTVLLEKGDISYAGTMGTKTDVIFSNQTGNLFGNQEDFLYLKKCSFLDKAQTISAIKTFSTLPESSVAPTSNNQLTNKAYVDGAISTAIGTALGGSY